MGPAVNPGARSRVKPNSTSTQGGVRGGSQRGLRPCRVWPCRANQSSEVAQFARRSVTRVDVAVTAGDTRGRFGLDSELIGAGSTRFRQSSGTTHPSTLLGVQGPRPIKDWRRRPDLNRGWSFCRALPYHLATAPIERMSASLLGSCGQRPERRALGVPTAARAVVRTRERRDESAWLANRSSRGRSHA